MSLSERKQQQLKEKKKRRRRVRERETERERSIYGQAGERESKKNGTHCVSLLL